MTAEEWDRFCRALIDFIDASRLRTVSFVAVPVLFALGAIVFLCIAADTAIDDGCMKSVDGRCVDYVAATAQWEWFWCLVVPPLVGLVPALLTVPNAAVLSARGKVKAVRTSERRLLRKDRDDARAALKRAEERTDALERELRMGPYADN